MAVIFGNRTGEILRNVARAWEGGAPLNPSTMGGRAAQPRKQKVQVQGPENPPPFAAMKVVFSYLDEDEHLITVVTKPDGSGGPFLFNGPLEIDAGTGAGRSGLVQTLPITGAPNASPGEIWGPIDDWYCTPDGSPAIQVLGQDPSSGRILGETAIGSTGGGLELVRGPSGGIEGRTGNEVPSGTAEIVAIDAYDQLVATGRNIRVYNWTTQLIWSKGERLGIAAIQGNGLWVAVSGDCHDDTDGDGTLPPPIDEEVT
jgi:hypothetical protein